MTSDLNRTLTLEYALGTNLPERIIHPGGHIRNCYTPAGRKTGKKVFDASNNLLSQELYYGDLIIKDGRASRILHADGVVNLSGGPPEFHYHLKDHLGNVRLVITPDASNNPVVLQANDYYPFGMSYSTVPGVNKYLYNSKEEQEMPGKFLDYGWRMYDAQLGRWHGVDIMSEQRYWLSPYNYVQNNPIIRIDPDGNIDWKVVGKGALGVAGGVGSLALAATITPSGIGIPAAGYLAVQGLAGASFGVTTMIVGFASPASQETQDLANEIPTCMLDVGAMIYQQANDIDSELPRTVAQTTSLITSFSLSKVPNTASNAVSLTTDVITAVQGANLVLESSRNNSNNNSEQISTEKVSTSDSNNTLRVSSMPDEKVIGSLPK
jgi:RHS repeat-associated protein